MGTSIIQDISRRQGAAQGDLPPAGRLTANMGMGSDYTLQELTEADELARMLAMPREMVLGDITSARAKAQAMKADRLSVKAPVTAQWAAKTPERTAVTQPSWDSLARIEDTFRNGPQPKTFSGFSTIPGQPNEVIPNPLAPRPFVFVPNREAQLPPAPSSLSIDLTAREYQLGALNRDKGLFYASMFTPSKLLLPENQRKIAEFAERERALNIPAMPGLLEAPGQRIVRETARMLPTLVGAGVEALAVGGVAAAGAAGVTAATGGFTAPSVPAAFGTGARLGAFEYVTRVEAGLNLERNLQVPNADPMTALLSAWATGIVAGSLEYVSGAKIVSSLGVTDDIVRGATRKALQTPTLGRALMNGAKVYVETGATEFVTEQFQSGLSIVSENITRVQAGAPRLTAEQIATELKETAVATIASMALIGAPGAARTTAVDAIKVQKAKRTQEFMAALGDEAKASELRTSAPGEFKEFLDEVTQMYGPVQDIMIPVERFNAYWQAQNVDPRAIAAEVLPDVNAYDQAVATGGDVVIPLSNYVATIAATDHHQPLIEDIRFRPDDLTAREARELEAKVGEDLDGLRTELETAVDETLTDVSDQRVFDDIVEKLTAAGTLTPDAVQVQAKAAAAAFITLARREGLDSWDVYQSRNITILDPARSERLFDAMAEMEQLLAEDPTSPAAAEAVARVNALRAEVEQEPTMAQRIAPVAMPLSAAQDGQRVTLADGRAATVVGRQGGQVMVRMAGEREPIAMAPDREVQTTPNVLMQEPTPIPADVVITRDENGVPDVEHKREKKTGRYVGAPDWIGSDEQQIKVLRAKLKQLALEGEVGRFWYEVSARAVLDFTDGDLAMAEKFIGLLAIFSPNTGVAANTTHAIKAWYQWKAGLPIQAGQFPQDMGRKANMWLYENKDWGGVKTNNFYLDLMEELDRERTTQPHATMDMWMALAFDYGDKVLDQGPKYNFAKREIVRLAEELGWRPHQVQAAVWTAIRSRVERSAKERKAYEREQGILVPGPEKNGKPTEVFAKGREYDHFRTATRFGMEYPITPEQIAEDNYDFAKALDERAVNLSWEATPGATSGVLPGIVTAPIEQRFEYLRAIRKALSNERGVDLIDLRLGLLTGNGLEAVSGWQGVSAPSVQQQIAVDLKNGVLQPQARTLVNLAADIRGLLLSQEAVAWHYPILSGAKYAQNGVAYNIGRSLTAAESEELYSALILELGRSDAPPIPTPNGFRVLNFPDEKFALMEEVSPEKRRALQKASLEKNVAFHDAVERAVARTSFGNEVTDAEEFESDGELRDNDWSEGDSAYRRRIAEATAELAASGDPRFADLQKWVDDDLRPRVEAVNREFADRYGWDGSTGAAGDGVVVDPPAPARPPETIPQKLEQAATDWMSRVPEDADQSIRMLARVAFLNPPVYVDLPETIDVDGVQRPTRNSLGQQITRDERTMRNFWRWFGDSKVVDEQGRPQVIYHGTNAAVDFVEFKPSTHELGIHVGTTFQANGFAADMPRITASAGSRVYPMYARIQNPLRLTDRGGFTSRNNVIAQLRNLGLITDAEIEKLAYFVDKVNVRRLRTDKQIEENTIRWLKDKGYDGIVYLNRYEGYSESDRNSGKFNDDQRKASNDEQWLEIFPAADDSHIVFDPQQVKSTTNVGSFNRALKNILRQDNTTRPNAFIIPGVARTTIGLMRTANLSSLMHEFSHDYLNLLFDLAQREGASAGIRADAELVLKEFGIENRGELTTEHQEKWARMFESYLMEGKAPSRELQSAFGRFRVWLTAIYRAVTTALVPVSPEIRGVFDRMLATDEQIAEVMAENEMTPLFESATEAGMTDAEFTAYTGAVSAQSEQAKRTLLARLMNERNKERRQFWKDREAEVRKTVTEQVALEPIQQVVHFLKTGTLLSGEALPEGVEAYKLSKVLLTARYGPDIVKSIPRGTYSVKDGIDSDVVAMAFGFDSGDAMITQMQAFEPREARINRIVKETMAREFPDLLQDSPALADAAQQAVHRSSADQLLYRELVKLGQLDAMVPPTNLLAVRQAAKDVIAKTRVRDLMPERFRRAEAKAGRLAYQAMRKGNVVQAAFHKRQQLLNHLLYREATDAIEMANDTYRFFGKMAKPSYQERIGKAGQEYLEQINTLLTQYDFSRISGIEAERRVASLSEWAATQMERGIPIEITPAVLYTVNNINYRLLTVEHLQGVYDAGRQIYHVARNQNKLLAAAAKESFEATVSDVVAGIGQNHKIEPREPDYAPSKLAAVANFFKAADAWHAKPEFLFRWLDGEEAFGPVHEALFEPIAQAENAESTMVLEANKRVEELFNLIPSDRRKQFLSRRIQVPGVSTRMSGATAVAVALNWGNTGNRQALLDGAVAGKPIFTPQQVDAILATLTKDEWAFVQGVWDYINEFWPQIAKLQQDMTGVAPEKVQAEPFTVTTADGETVNLRGGYYPLAYDRNLSWTQQVQDLAADVQDIGTNSYTRAATRHGFTEARVGSGGRPVRLDLSVFSEHVLNVIHDLTHRKAVLDVQRLLDNSDVRNAIEGTAGRELYKSLRPWLVRVAGDRKPPASPLESLIGRARIGVTVVNMGLKVTTAVVQPIGYLSSVESLGIAYARRGLTAFFANPAKLTALVKEYSVSIRTRQQSFDRDVRDQTKRLLKKGPITRAQQSFFFFTGLMDMAVAVPTWYGAYLKSIETLKPGDHHAAVTYADSIVRTTQGSGAAKDLAQIQGGGELQRSFTLFYTYFNTLYNQLRRSGALLKDRGPRDTGRFLASMALLWFLPAVLSELIANRGPDEDEDEDAMQWALWKIARYPFGTVIGVRDAAAAIGPEAYKYELSPVVSAARSVIESANAIGKAAYGAYQGDGFELTEGEVKQFIMAIGYWGQLPSRQMWITGSYIYDWMMGYEEPEQPAEALRGLAFPRQQQ